MNKKVLIVDDEPDVLFTVCRMLEMNGYSVIKANNGKECIEKLTEHNPDLVLLDIIRERVYREKMVERHVEEALDLSGVQVYGQHPVRPRCRKKVRHQLRGYGHSGLVLSVLSCIAVIGYHRGYPLGGRAF